MGGRIELWDKDVKVCHQSFSPIFNRCVIFETTEISFHGVTAVHCPPGISRKSFAAHYYTTEAPAHWTGEAHSIIFRARPTRSCRGCCSGPRRRSSAGCFRRSDRSSGEPSESHRSREAVLLLRLSPKHGTSPRPLTTTLHRGGRVIRGLACEDFPVEIDEARRLAVPGELGTGALAGDVP
jgi:hypothetical protein